MAYNHTVMGPILKLVSRHEFEGETRRHHEGGRLRKMTRWVLGSPIGTLPLLLLTQTLIHPPARPS